MVLPALYADAVVVTQPLNGDEYTLVPSQPSVVSVVVLPALKADSVAASHDVYGEVYDTTVRQPSVLSPVRLLES